MAEIVTKEARFFLFCRFLLIVMQFESLSRRLSQMILQTSSHKKYRLQINIPISGFNSQFGHFYGVIS